MHMQLGDPADRLVLCQAFAERLPTGDDGDAVRQRSMLLKAFDGNGNGRLSLSELWAGLRLIFGFSFAPPLEADQAMVTAKPAILMAFEAANEAGGKEGFVKRETFVTLLLFLQASTVRAAAP